MMIFDPHNPSYFDSADLDTEFKRVMDICNGCRLCDALCPPFTDVFDRIDQEDDKQTAAGIGQENPVHQLKEQDYKNVVDTCYQCKLCYPKCPYTPPHQYMLDFPRLLLRADAINKKEKGRTTKQIIRDTITGNTNRSGKIGSMIPGIMNWGAENTLARSVMESVAGIDHRKTLPTFYKQTFREWYDGRVQPKPAQPIDRVAIFVTCQIDYNRPWVGKQYVEILEKHGVELIIPEQECCGMPQLGTGIVEDAIAAVDRNVARLKPIVEAGFKLIAMAPSCSMMLRQEYAHYATDKIAAEKIMAATVDPCEYLMQLIKAKKITFDFTTPVAEKITYHLSCHLRVQNVGFNSRDLMKLIPGVKVNMIQQCSGHDGAWSSKQEYYEISLDVGKKLFKAIDKDKPTLVAGDCTLAHLHIEEGTGEEALHPIEIVYRALGYTEHMN